MKNVRNIVCYIGMALGHLRRNKGMTQAQVADLMGVSRPRISKIENGREPGLTIYNCILHLQILGVDTNKMTLGMLVGVFIDLILLGKKKKSITPNVNNL